MKAANRRQNVPVVLTGIVRKTSGSEERSRSTSWTSPAV
jgi:hypothetical protein